METRTLEITLSQAQEWFKSGMSDLKDIALQVFSEKELEFDFTQIKTFEDALDALNYDEMYKNSIYAAIESMNEISPVSAALFKLKIIRKALNIGFDLHYTEYAGNEIWYPTIEYVKDKCNYIIQNIRESKIGEFTFKNTIYEVFSGSDCRDDMYGLLQLDSNKEIGDNYNFDLTILGCVSDSIANHFSKYFGMLILEAMYGDLEGFKIIERHGCN